MQTCSVFFLHSIILACMVRSFQLCLTFCDPVDCSLPGFVHGILQAIMREKLPCPPPGDLPNPGIKPRCLMSPELAGGFFTLSATLEGTCYTGQLVNTWSYFLKTGNIRTTGVNTLQKNKKVTSKTSKQFSSSRSLAQYCIWMWSVPHKDILNQ